MRTPLLLGALLLGGLNASVAWAQDADDPSELAPRQARTQEVLNDAGFFGNDELESVRYDTVIFDTAPDGRSQNLLLLGNVVLTGYGFEVRADGIGIWIDGLDEAGRPLRPRMFASGNVLLLRGDQSFRAETLFIEADTRTAVLTEMRLRITQELVEVLRQDPVGSPQRARAITTAFGAPIEVDPQELQDPTPIVFAARELTIRDFQQIEGTGVEFTTCEFGHPHWALEAEAGRAEARLEVDAVPGEVEPGGWLFHLDSVSLRAGPVPIPLLPGVMWDSRWGRYIPLRSVSVSRSTKFGDRVDTLWNGNLLLPDVLSQDMDLGIRLDSLSKRGTGYGVDAEWGRDPTRWAEEPDGRLDLFGYGSWWAIEEKGFDRDGTTPDDPHRFRSRFHQRMRLWGGTLIDLEYADESDPNFLLEYFENEARGEKVPENVVFLRRNLGIGQLSLLHLRQGDGFRTVLERLPELRTDIVEVELATDLFLDVDARLGSYEFEPGDGSLDPSVSNRRGDLEVRFTRAFELGRGLRLLPFVRPRVSWWEEGADERDEPTRYAMDGGVGLSNRVWRTYDLRLPELGLNGLRHVVDFDISARSLLSNSLDTDELVVIDDLEAIDERDVVRLALYQRLLTRRVDGGRSGLLEEVRSVLDTRLAVEWFPEAERDNGGEDWGELDAEVILSPFRNLGVFVDGSVDVESGDVQEVNAGVRWLQPRAAYLELSERRRRGLQDSIVLGARWWGSEKYEFAVFGEYDLDRSEAVNQRFEITRNFHRFAASFSMEVDEGEDNTTFLVTFGPRDLFGARDLDRLR